MKMFLKVNHDFIHAVVNAVFYCCIGFFIGIVYTANFVTTAPYYVSKIK